MTGRGDFTQNAIGFSNLSNYTLAISMPEQMGPGQFSEYSHFTVSTLFICANEEYMPHLILFPFRLRFNAIPRSETGNMADDCLALDARESAQHAYEEGHKICWLAYRKYKESAHMYLVAHPISQPSLDISPIWTPIIATEIRQLHLRPV
jgi:hypothetical protein